MRLVAFLSAVLACVVAGAQATRADPAGDSRISAVIVSSHIASHQDAIGAGVIVEMIPHGLRIVTAKHVADSGDVTVWIEHTPYPAEIVRTFDHRDLAVIDALVPASRTAKLRAALIGVGGESGQSVQIWGEDDAGPRLVQGTIVDPRSRLTAPAGSTLIGFACAACRHGDSGAGLFGPDGRLLGVLSARLQTLDDRTVMFVAEPIDSSVYTTPSQSLTTADK